MVLFARPVLGAVPMPVLTGLFLYLGLSALGGNQMYVGECGRQQSHSTAEL